MKTKTKPDYILLFENAVGCGFVGIGIGLFLAAIGRFHIRFGLPVFITDLITIIFSFFVGSGLYLVLFWFTTLIKRFKKDDLEH